MTKTLPTGTKASLRLLIVALAMLLCISCSRKKELTFMTGGAAHEFAFWEKVVADFQKETGIPVSLIRSATQTEQRKQQIMVGLRGKKPDPDVFAMDIAWIGQLASSQWLEPLGYYDINASDYFDNIIRLADTHDGQLIGLPLWVDAGLLYYRKDLLEKYGFDGPPVTWDELISMARKVQKGERKTNPEFWGFVWQGAQYEGLVCNALEYFKSSGGGFFDDIGTPRLVSHENIRALKLMSAIINKLKISPPNTFTDMKEEEVRLVFQNGNALFERNWPYAMKLHSGDDSPVKDKYDIAVLPHFEGRKSAATLGGWHVGLSRFSDMKKEAAQFVKYLGSYEIQKALAVKMAHNPGRPDVYEDPDVKDTPIGRLKPIMQAAVPRPTVPYYSQVSSILQKHINAAISGKVEADEALNRRRRKSRALLWSSGPAASEW